MGTKVNDTKEMSIKEKIRKIAKHYEYETQSLQCIEEMAELIQAINKYWKSELQCGKYLYDPWDGYMPSDSYEYLNLVEEIADVQIMLEQMKFFLSAETTVKKIMEEKIERQLKRIQEENT